MPPILRRLLLVGGAGLLGSLFLGAVAGNLGLRATGPEDPTAAFAAAGAVAVAGAVVTLAVVAAMAVRAARRPTQAAPAAPTAPTALATTGSEGAQGSPAPAVAVHGAAPEEAARLEALLRPVSSVLGQPLVVVTTPGRPRAWRLERGILVRVARPEERLVLAALEGLFQGDGQGSTPAGAPRQERPSRRAPEAGGPQSARRPRPEDIAAAVGGAAPEGEAK